MTPTADLMRLEQIKGELYADIDTMRDVYMTGKQREAYERIVARAATYRAALPAIREAVGREFVLIDKGAVKMVENVLRRAGKDEVADEMLSAIGRATLTSQEEKRNALPYRAI